MGSYIFFLNFNIILIKFYLRKCFFSIYDVFGMGEIKQIDESCYLNSYNFGVYMMMLEVINV